TRRRHDASSARTTEITVAAVSDRRRRSESAATEELPDRLGPRAWSFVTDHAQVIAIFVLWQAIYDFREIGLADETHAEGDFFEAGDFEALPVFDRGDVVARLEQRRGRAGIEPGHAAAEQFHVQLAALEVAKIEIGDLQLFARGRLQTARKIDSLLVINVKTGHGEMALRLFRFFLD